MGSKSSTASTNVTKDTTTSNVDYRATDGEGSIGGNVNLNLSDSDISGAVAITTTDFGALDAASDLSDMALASVDRSVEAIVDSNAESTDALRKTADAALDVAEKAQQADSAQTLNILIIGATVAVVAWAVVRRKRS